MNERIGDEVAIKLESLSNRNPQLHYEYKVYQLLKGGIGIPSALYYSREGSYNVMVMDLLGPSLEDLFNYCNRKFSLKTVCMLAREMILRLEYVHSKNLIHRDIKPDNFTVGLNKEANVVFLIDYGLCKPYRNMMTWEHIPWLCRWQFMNRYRENKSLTGTPRYASLNNHLGMEQSRRDDLESLGYVFIYFLWGKLPWQGLRAETKEEKYSRIMECKLEVGFERLCQGFPDEFLTYFDYCHSLGFNETPDYSYLRNLFAEVMSRRVATGSAWNVEYRGWWGLRLDGRLAESHDLRTSKALCERWRIDPPGLTEASTEDTPWVNDSRRFSIVICVTSRVCKTSTVTYKSPRCPQKCIVVWGCRLCDSVHCRITLDLQMYLTKVGHCHLDTRILLHNSPVKEIWTVLVLRLTRWVVLERCRI